MVTSPTHQMLIDECLNGYGISCLHANSYTTDNLSEMYYCFNYGDPTMCDEAVMMYPEEMSNFLGSPSSPTHQMLIDECLNGYGISCLQANSYITDNFPPECIIVLIMEIRPCVMKLL